MLKLIGMFISITALITAFITMILASVAGYITHLVWWIKLLMNNELDTHAEFFLALIGTLIAPIGSIHGIILWF